MDNPPAPPGGNDLGDFLRARRAALDPRRAGLPDDGRLRRVPGLRREELSQLANVSIDYVVRLEQGRTRRVSRPVLGALADALQLTPDERAYLARPQPGQADVSRSRIPVPVRRLAAGRTRLRRSPTDGSRPAPRRPSCHTK